MEWTMDKMLEEAAALPVVSPQEAALYDELRPQLIRFVNGQLESRAEIADLIGNNPFDVMRTNHDNHAAFMSTVFGIGNVELLTRTIPWVYRAYAGQGFQFAYFPVELTAWMEAVRTHAGAQQASSILNVYEWMLDRHEAWIALSRESDALHVPLEARWFEHKAAFLDAAMQGKHQECMAIAQTAVQKTDDVAGFYLQVLQPVMQDVGMLWETGEITVAEEHLVSSIVSRVMVTISMTHITGMRGRRKAIVTSAPNEFHEIGAWMLSDMLEMDGWDVRYLGANTPETDLLELARAFQPDLLAVSVTMPFNIPKARHLVSELRRDPQLSATRVMVGGRAFSGAQDIWRSTGADLYAADLRDIPSQLQMVVPA